MFRLERAEIQTLIESERSRLLRTGARLRQIEAGEMHNVVLKSVAAKKAVSIRQSMARAGMPTFRSYFARFQIYLYQKQGALFMRYGVYLSIDNEYSNPNLLADERCSSGFSQKRWCSVRAMISSCSA